VPAIDRLVQTLARLRQPGGCPWDREQTFASLRRYLLEEAYEVAEAIDSGDLGALREELGDLLLQVVFLSRIAEEERAFDLEQVAQGIVDKLIRRHPHVFGDSDAATTDEALRHWEESKARESSATADGGERRSKLDGIPRQLPALATAHKLAGRAARAGFAWPAADSVIEKIAEEVEELRRAVAEDAPPRVEEELGDLLFACASLARTVGVDPEGALARANRKFGARFRHIESAALAAGRRMDSMTDAELDGLWRIAKRETDEPERG